MEISPDRAASQAQSGKKQADGTEQHEKKKVRIYCLFHIGNESGVERKPAKEKYRNKAIPSQYYVIQTFVYFISLIMDYTVDL